MCSSSQAHRWLRPRRRMCVGSMLYFAALGCSSAFCWGPPLAAPSAPGRRVIAGSTPRLRTRTGGSAPHCDDLRHCCPTRPSRFASGGDGVQRKRRGAGGVGRLRCSAASSSSSAASAATTTGEVLAASEAAVEPAGSDAV